MEVVFRAGCEREGVGKFGDDGCRGADAVDGELEVVNRVFRAVGRVFDRAAGQSRGGCLAHRLSDGFRIVAEAVFEVGTDRQTGGADDFAAVSENRVAAHSVIAVAPRKGKAGAGGGQSLETEPLKDAGGAKVPWVGDQEGLRSLVQGTEQLGFLGLGFVSLAGGRHVWLWFNFGFWIFDFGFGGVGPIWDWWCGWNDCRRLSKEDEAIAAVGLRACWTGV